MFLSLVRPDRISSPITRMDAVTISVMSQFLILPEPCPGAVLMSSGYADQTCSVQPFFKAVRRQPTNCPPQMHIGLARHLLPYRFVVQCGHDLEPGQG